jgi:hypothetical protein
LVAASLLWSPLHCFGRRFAVLINDKLSPSWSTSLSRDQSMFHTGVSNIPHGRLFHIGNYSNTGVCDLSQTTKR